MDSIDTFWIGWTTFSTEDEANQMAKKIIEKRLAFCVQVEGPITSTYWWEGKIEQNKEYRMMLKFTGWKRMELMKFISTHHPYSLPEMTFSRMDEMSDKYKTWAMKVTNLNDK